jgi:hypothetical protein
VEFHVQRNVVFGLCGTRVRRRPALSVSSIVEDDENAAMYVQVEKMKDYNDADG